MKNLVWAMFALIATTNAVQALTMTITFSPNPLYLKKGESKFWTVTFAGKDGPTLSNIQGKHDVTSDYGLATNPVLSYDPFPIPAKADGTFSYAFGIKVKCDQDCYIWFQNGVDAQGDPRWRLAGRESANITSTFTEKHTSEKFTGAGKVFCTPEPGTWVAFALGATVLGRALRR